MVSQPSRAAPRREARSSSARAERVPRKNVASATRGVGAEGPRSARATPPTAGAEAAGC